MKNKKLLIYCLSIAVLIMFTMAIAACDKSKASKVLELNYTSVILDSGSTHMLTATLDKEPVTGVTFGSQNNAVASVDQSGLITAVAEGITKIKAEYLQLSAECTVRVDSVPLKEDVMLSLNITELTVKYGAESTYPLIASLRKGTEELDTHSLVWNSSDKDVAEVTGGIVSVVGKGKAVVSVKYTDGDFWAEAKCTVVIEEDISLNIIKPSQTLLKAGDVLPLDYRLYINGSLSVEAVAWSVSDLSIATIAQDGNLTVMSGGSVTVYADYGGKRAEYPIKAYGYKAISTKQDFLSLGDKSKDCYYELKNDISLVGEDFKFTDGIMSVIANFDGHIQGNGYKVSAVRALPSANDGTFVTLFGNIGENAVVENVNFNIDIALKAKTATGVFAAANKGVIKNCFITIVSHTSASATGEAARPSVIWEHSGVLQKIIFDLSYYHTNASGTQNGEYFRGLTAVTSGSIDDIMIIARTGSITSAIPGYINRISATRVIDSYSGITVYTGFNKILDGGGYVMSKGDNANAAKLTATQPGEKAYLAWEGDIWSFNEGLKKITILGKDIIN